MPMRLADRVRGRSDLLDLVFSESGEIGRELFIAAAASGLANAGILAIVNSAAQQASSETPGIRLLGLFVVAMAIYIHSLRFTFRRANEVFADVIHRVRVRLANKIRHSELVTLERIGIGPIYNVMSQQTHVITETAMLISGSLQASIMIVFASLYIIVLSVPAFLLTTVLLGVGVWMYRERQTEARTSIQQATQKDIEFFDTVTHALRGFKETKLNEPRARDLYTDLAEVSAQQRTLHAATTEIFTQNYIFSQSVFYVVIAAIVFLLPRLLPTYGENLSQITTAILFIVGPLSMVVSSVPQFANANLAAGQIRELERTLDELNQWGEEAPDAGLGAGKAGFERIELDEITFSYYAPAGETLFTVGPASLSLDAGEILFIIGGNGSGKTTLLNVLTYLYPPESGVIRCDGVEIDGENASEYRSLFAAIFADFHLFEKLYGLYDADPEGVEALLQQMQIADKTSFVDDRFTELDLSTGQKKRLALVITLLDDRPIFVFDELAADQDPAFRRFLYEELLPNLKRRGKTIVAVTHDDRYFGIADRVVKMEYGKFVPYTQPS